MTCEFVSVVYFEGYIFAFETSGAVWRFDPRAPYVWEFVCHGPQTRPVSPQIAVSVAAKPTTPAVPATPAIPATPAVPATPTTPTVPEVKKTK